MEVAAEAVAKSLEPSLGKCRRLRQASVRTRTSSWTRLLTCPSLSRSLTRWSLSLLCGSCRFLRCWSWRSLRSHSCSLLRKSLRSLVSWCRRAENCGSSAVAVRRRGRCPPCRCAEAVPHGLDYSVDHCGSTVAAH